jgi:hypothetical protein
VPWPAAAAAMALALGTSVFLFQAIAPRLF